MQFLIQWMSWALHSRTGVLELKQLWLSCHCWCHWWLIVTVGVGQCSCVHSVVHCSGGWRWNWSVWY